MKWASGVQPDHSQGATAAGILLGTSCRPGTPGPAGTMLCAHVLVVRKDGWTWKQEALSESRGPNAAILALGGLPEHISPGRNQNHVEGWMDSRTEAGVTGGHGRVWMWLLSTLLAWWGASTWTGRGGPVGFLPADHMGKGSEGPWGRAD